MIRTIEEMEKTDALATVDNFISVSDVLLFAIVAGDYLRAKRRRFPLDDPDGKSDHVNDNTTFNLRALVMSDEIHKGIVIENYYFRLNVLSDGPYLFDYTKEYIE